MAGNRRWKITASLVAGLMGGGAWYLTRPVPVQVIHPQRKDVTETIDLDGRIRPIYTEDVRCPLSVARIKRVMVTEGQVVRPGQGLVEFDDSKSRADFARLQSEAKIARKGLDITRDAVAARRTNQFNRNKKVVEVCWESKRKAMYALARARREGTPEEIREAEAAVQKAAATLAWCSRARFQVYSSPPVGLMPQVVEANHRLDRAEAALRTAERRPTEKYVRSRVSGLVLRRRAGPGEVVTRYQPLIDVVAFGSLGVGVRIPSDWHKGGTIQGKSYDQVIYPRYARDRSLGRFGVAVTAAIPGADATVTIPSLGNKEFPGSVHGGSRLENGQEILHISFDAPMQARPGMPATAHIITDRLPNALTVPSGTVVDRTTQPAVFVVRDGRVVRQPVKIGIASKPQIVVKEGLGDGETVIEHPDKVTVGQRIRAVPVRL